MNEKIKVTILDAIQVLEGYRNINFEPVKIVIDECYFDEKYCNQINITKSDEHSTLFNNLKMIKNPVLYWFDFEYTEERNNKINTKYRYYRNKIKKDYTNPLYRNIAAHKATHNPQSKTLYVGKVETGFWTRIETHLGYRSNKGTAGLQLHYWYYPDISIFGNLTLNYIVFEPNMKHLISILEKKLALDLEPLIGKH